MNYYVNVQGGTGLNLAFASFISKYKKENDKFFVCSPYSDIFECCEAVDGVYRPQEIKDFIFDAAADEDSKIINHRLYDMDGFIKKQLNYETAWNELIYNEKSSDIKEMDLVSTLNILKRYPNIKNNINELENVLKQKNFKDFIIVQFTGGQSPLVQVPLSEDGKSRDWNKVPYDYLNEPLKRHYPIEKAQEFIELFHKVHPDTGVISFQLPNEPSVSGDFVIRGTLPYLAYYEFAKLPECTGIVTIDSCLQHLTAGITRAVVLWGHSKPIHFGYNYNKNIEQKCRTDDLLYFTALGPSAAKISYIEPNDLLDIVDDYLYNRGNATN
jgi:hypothetical protein